LVFLSQDTKEVDDAVTAEIQSSLDSFDWDVLILHYLGLDHVGHTGGPQSPLMIPKQKEMDAIVKHIHQSLLEKDK
jgi:ethanolaminephosphotransferase